MLGAAGPSPALRRRSERYRSHRTQPLVAVLPPVRASFAAKLESTMEQNVPRVKNKMFLF